jgi:hypothetical protein
MNENQFPLPVTIFSRDLARNCAAALESAWTALAAQRDAMMASSELVRLKLAEGIVIAVSLGARDPKRLADYALRHLDREASQNLLRLAPLPDEPPRPHQHPDRYRFRAEELRVVTEGTKTPLCREVLAAISADYERMAKSAESIASSRAALNGSKIPS